MYKLTNSENIQRLSDGATIPADTGNLDYVEYQAWLAEGNTPEPVDPPVPPTPLEQIRALESQYADDQAKLTRQSLLALALDKASSLPEAAGLTRAQVHALLLTEDNGYAALYHLEEQIAALRTKL